MPPFPHNDRCRLIRTDHRQWLSSFDSRYTSKWDALFKGDPEAALYEACVRRTLQPQCDLIEPNENLTGKCGGPDYRCWTGNQHFYVEATCISVAIALEKSKPCKSLPPSFRGLPFDVLDAIFSKCRNKYGQVSGLDGPCLLAVGTFEGVVSMNLREKAFLSQLLSGRTQMAWEVDIRTGESGEVYHATKLQAATFLRQRQNDPDELDFRNTPFSGLLIGGIESQFVGVLHPSPKIRFDPATLPHVDFGQVTINPALGALSVQWL